LHRGRDAYSPGTLLSHRRSAPHLCTLYRELGRTGRLLADSLDNLGYRHTMIGRLRLDEYRGVSLSPSGVTTSPAIDRVRVWRGGAAVFMRGFLKAFGMLTARCG